MPNNITKSNTHGYPYVEIPSEYLAGLAALEDPNILNESLSYEDFLGCCAEYGSMYSWLESYQFDLYGPPPPEEEFDPMAIADLVARFEALAKRFYAVEKAPQLVAASLERTTPPDCSDDAWALYAMATDPISIGGIDSRGIGYPLLLRQLTLAGDLESAVLIHAPIWFPTWLHDHHLRRPCIRVSDTRPTASELDTHVAALRLWRPYEPSHVFHKYTTAFTAAKKTWQNAASI